MQQRRCQWCELELRAPTQSAPDVILAALRAGFCSPRHEQLYARREAEDCRAWWQTDLGASKR